MPSIDISRYNKQKVKKSVGHNRFSVTDFLTRDIKFGNTELSDKKKESFYLELSSLLIAGINLKESLDLVMEDQKNENDKSLYGKIREMVLKGETFAKTLQRTGRFSIYEIFSLEIGEETGKLTEVLTDLAKFYQNKIKQRRKIISVLTYPCVVMICAFGAVVFMLKFVVPMFGDVFRRFGGQLPWITEKIIGISNIMEDNFLRFFILIILCSGTMFYVRKTEKFRKISSQMFRKIPVIGNIIQKIYLARFCNAMRMLINAHLPLLNSIDLVRQMIGYYPIESSLKTVEENILNGEALNDSLRKFDIYPSKMIQLIKIGEEANKLDYFFEKIADQYLEEVEYKTATLSSIIEPVIMLFLGLVVCVILVSMYLPLFQMSNSFQ